MVFVIWGVYLLVVWCMEWVLLCEMLILLVLVVVVVLVLIVV